MRAIVYFILFFGLNAFSQSTQLFEEGNAAYAEADYELAVGKYEQILKAEETAAEVHFNLANAYYKLNEVAPSIYHYEKALQLAPNDKDIKNNLSFAQNMAIDVEETVPEAGFSRWWFSVLNSFSASGWAWAGISFMFLFALLFLGYYFMKKPFLKRVLFLSSLVFFVFALGTLAIGFSKLSVVENRNYAIIFAEEVEIKNEPSPRGEELFFLHEGAKVKVLEDFQEWSKIELANGNQGWLEREAIKKL